MKIETAGVMNNERGEAQRVVGVLNNAEEALAALDQLAGSETNVEMAAKDCYDEILKSIRRTFEQWNDEHVYSVARCHIAEDHDYYTAADGKCDVWVLVQDATEDGDGRIWCEGCATAAAEKYEASKESM